MSATLGETARTFSDSRPVRLRFTPTVPTFSARTLWVRVYRDRLNELVVPGRLTAKLYRGTTLLAAVTKPASAFALTALDTSWDDKTTPAAVPIPFVNIDLGLQIEVQTLLEHSIVLGAEGGEYTIHAQAWDTNFLSRNSFTDGVAEYSSNSGAAWNSWTSAGGFTSSQMVLPFMLQAGGATAPPVQALMSNSLVAAAGVNTKFPTAAYNDIYATLKALLLEAKLSWIRDDPTSTTQNRGRFLDLAAAGIKTLLIAGNGGHGFETADNILAYVKALNTAGGGEGSVCFAVQSENEPDNVGGETSADWLPRIETQMTEIGTDYPADPAADSLLLVGPGFFAPTSAALLLAKFSTAPAFMTHAGLHAYHAGRHPESASGAGSGVSLQQGMLNAQLSGADPVIITATSYRVRSELGGGKWWNLPIRSGRPWAGGPSYWGQSTAATDAYVAEEGDVALLDAINGSSKAADRGNVSTWDRLIGGPIGGARVDIDTQFDWRLTTSFGFGSGMLYLPKGAAYPDGSAWLVWAIDTIPDTEATTASNSHIWDDIIAGNHDAKYIKFGERIVAKMTAIGHPLKRLLVDANHEMNQSNSYQVFANSYVRYKAALERTITKIREGAGTNNYIRFIHRPAYRGEPKPAAYAAYVPSNVDVLALSIHPNAAVNSDANITKMFNGTLNSEWYGTDELLATATALNKPIAFPEWSPKYEADDACPVANTFITRFYNEVLAPNADRLVCDCVFSRNVRDPAAYEGTTSGGQTQWSNMVATRKTLWSGLKTGEALAASFINVYEMEDEKPERAGDIITPTFDATHTNTTSGLGDLTNKIVSWRGKIGSAHYAGADKTDNTIYRITGSNVKSTTVFCGGSTNETNPDYVDGNWAHTHGNDATGENSPGLRFDVAPLGMKCQGFDLKHCMDAVIPGSVTDTEFPVLENFRIINCHDDCIQNDGGSNGIYRNGLMKGHVWLSVRSVAPSLRNKFSYCLIHMDRGRYTNEEPENQPVPPQIPFAGSKRSGKYISPTQRNNTIITGTNLGWAHKWFIKTSGDGGIYQAKADVDHCLFRIDTPPVEGYDNPGYFPTDWTYDHVHVCWLGPPANGTGYGPWPFQQSKAQLASLGITLHDDENEAFDLWSEAEARWYTANGWNGATYLDPTGTFSWNRVLP